MVGEFAGIDESARAGGFRFGDLGSYVPGGTGFHQGSQGGLGIHGIA